MQIFEFSILAAQMRGLYAQFEIEKKSSTQGLGSTNVITPQILSVGQVGVPISVSMHGFRISFGYKKNAVRLTSGCHTSLFLEQMDDRDSDIYIYACNLNHPISAAPISIKQVNGVLIWRSMAFTWPIKQCYEKDLGSIHAWRKVFLIWCSCHHRVQVYVEIWTRALVSFPGCAARR